MWRALRPAWSYCFVGRVVVDEAVGQHHRPHLEAAIEQAAHARDDAAPALAKPPIAPSSIVISTSCSRASRSTRCGVERLGEARIGHRRRRGRSRASSSAALRHSWSRVPRLRIAIVVPSRTHPAPADLAAASPRAGSVDADALAARIAHRRRAVVDRRAGRHHVHQLGLVRRRHDHETRQAAEIGEIERARMGRAVGADQARAVHREAHRQFLDRHVVHDLVVGALQEGRVDRGEGLQALAGEAGGEGHRRAARRCRHRRQRSGNRSANLSRPVPDGIAAVIATMRSSALGLGDQRLGEDLGVARRAAPCPSAAAPVATSNFDDAVILVGRRLGRRVAMALLRHDMDQHRAAARRSSRTFFSTGSRWSRLWPSIGPT